MAELGECGKRDTKLASVKVADQVGFIEINLCRVLVVERLDLGPSSKKILDGHPRQGYPVHKHGLEGESKIPSGKYR